MVRSYDIAPTVGVRGGGDLNDVADSEGETQLVCRSWVVKETQEADTMQSDN
jgi:hypothetical protein